MLFSASRKRSVVQAYYKKNENVSTTQKLNFARDACRGMCYLSGSKVIHRDIAARNCLLGSLNEVKISDFGLSVVDKNELRLSRLHKVPIRWLSPETLIEGVFTTKTDVWSFGVLVWEIFANCTSDPFPGVNNAEAIGLITGKKAPMEPPAGSPPIAKQVMDLCFIKDPDTRADFATIFRLLAPSEPLPTPTKINLVDAHDQSIKENNAAHMPPSSSS
ncbi:protein tyrosine kinase [Oesophagostomum dentatum]|uniref:Protein tyrosine kinase n=1 Tax=Oesophagostomum dentatum TaxID=61180 RepID=A0A0B1T168_OESDE|nr:protein tyrosine kinase [Oesophagostomum dentatum]